MGEVDVPADALWGASTQRAVENFPISGQGIGRELIGALGRIKAAAAEVNGAPGSRRPTDMAAAIAEAAAEVAAGHWDAHFPVDVFQTGSGTSSNMNANEVHRRAGRPRAWAGPSTPTTTSTRPSRRTTSSRRPSTWPR